jgi:DNA/RNA-binding domain of Phe-tRNA-synthetase-like protein
MLYISATQAWRTSHPGACIGLLELSGVDNHGISPRLDERKRQVETALRRRYQGFSRGDFLSLPVMVGYVRYYKRFKKTYHVLLQVESIVLKGKHLPHISPLVDANFMAEVETFVLTAGHDVNKLQGALSIDVSRAGDHITQMSGVSKVIAAGDMVMKDIRAISCSILYGQDNRSPISPQTTHVLYVAYAPEGVPHEQVEAQLSKIEGNVRIFAPRAVVEQCKLLTTGKRTAG